MVSGGLGVLKRILLNKRLCWKNRGARFMFCFLVFEASRASPADGAVMLVPCTLCSPPPRGSKHPKQSSGWLSWPANDDNRTCAQHARAARRAAGHHSQAIAAYLRAVYPTAFLDGARALDGLFLSRLWYYSLSPEPPWAVLLAAHVPARTELRPWCASSPRSPFQGRVRSPDCLAGLYDADLLRCASACACATALRRVQPGWAREGYLEVWHVARTAWEGRRAPRLWSEVVDAQSRHSRSVWGSGLWYMHAPGSGIFYRTGRLLAAATKPAMLLKLLRLAEERAPGAEAVREFALRVSLPGANTSSLLASLEALVSGDCACGRADARICNAPEGSSFTFGDDSDGVMARLGRLLGFDTLLLTASFSTTGVHHGRADAELVDLRRPSGLQRLQAEEGARRLVRDASTRLSLRDPLNTTAPGLPCRPNFSAPSAYVTCANHPSAAFASLAGGAIWNFNRPNCDVGVPLVESPTFSPPPLRALRGARRV